MRRVLVEAPAGTPLAGRLVTNPSTSAAERDDPTQKAVHYRLMRLYTTAGESASAAREKALFQKSSQ